VCARARRDVGGDTVHGDEGDDRLFTRDGVADQVNCGPGFDRARVDQLDVVAADCERVRLRWRPRG